MWHYSQKRQKEPLHGPNVKTRFIHRVLSLSKQHLPYSYIYCQCFSPFPPFFFSVSHPHSWSRSHLASSIFSRPSNCHANRGTVFSPSVIIFFHFWQCFFNISCSRIRMQSFIAHLFSESWLWQRMSVHGISKIGWRLLKANAVFFKFFLNSQNHSWCYWDNFFKEILLFFIHFFCKQAVVMTT